VVSDPDYRHTRNLVVSHAGETVLERLYGAGSVKEPVDTYSMTKSVVATPAGVALDRGLIASSSLWADPSARSEYRRRLAGALVRLRPGRAIDGR
jgi:hypothetical protein